MNLIKQLISKSGKYLGSGFNHDNQKFIGEFELKPIVDNFGVEITFSATGEDGTSYHKEKTIITLDENNKICMWSLNSNAPMMFKFEIRDFTNEFILFGLNNPNDFNVFREEIKIDLLTTGEIGYHYSWGMPGGEFAYRSGLSMKM